LKPRLVMKNKNAETGNEEQAYNQAIKYLSARFFTVGEMQDKLLRRGFGRATVLPVIRRLEDLDFLNDSRYAEIFVENLKRYKDFGYYGIKVKLMKKKISADVTEKVLEDYFPVEDEMLVAEKFLKKLKKVGRESYDKIARSMTSKGFRTEVVASALHELFEKKEE
jgi:regulatory protein